jgi:exopolysaccharide biosynthesis WecB/TagA/CpsF family protein
MEKSIRREPLAVTALAVHGLILAHLHKEFGDKLGQFDVVAPDGQPVRWAINVLSGIGLKERVYGPTLMWRICEKAAVKGVSIYLYGSHDYVLQGLEQNFKKNIPNLTIAGMQPSVFRPLTSKEDEVLIKQIRESGAGIVFIGLGCPLQENWVYEHRLKIPIPLIAVGAAFDFHAGNKPQAPAWMQARGLEWLFRLLCEPRRLWRRYLVYNSLFVILFLKQLMGLTFKRS